MFKKASKETVDTTTIEVSAGSATAEVTPVVMNDVAISMVKCDNPITFTIVKLPFDMATMTTGKPEIVEVCTDRESANQTFKITAVKLGIVR